MQYYEVLVAQEYSSNNSVFTYSYTSELTLLQYIIVPLKSKQSVGIVVKKVPKPTFKTKQILHVMPHYLLPNQRHILRFLKEYYDATEAQALQFFIPSYLSKLTNVKSKKIKTTEVRTSLPPLTGDQSSALAILRSHASDTVVLHGDTGTGKTRVFIELAKQEIARGKMVVILSPEIALIPQLYGVFLDIFGSETVDCYHSALTANERAMVWQRIHVNTTKILIGTRSALFLPFKDIGLIVVDEAHEPSYKQDEGIRYHASRVASTLASVHNAQLIFASATPLVGDIYLAKQRNKQIIRMRQTAVESSSQATVVVVDMKTKEEFSSHHLLSNSLLLAIDQALKRGEQSLVYLNRRGTARAILCNSCGWQAICPTCNVSLTYHHDHHRLRCHICGYSQSAPSTCPICKSDDILFKSAGTKALESWLQKQYPLAKVGRFDTDNTKAESLTTRHSDVASGNIDILVGTQMLVKGLDLPKLSVVGIVAADLSLQIPDFSAEERTYQLLNQAIGRVGRGHRNSTTIIQTFNPNNKIIRQAITKNYDDFYTTQIDQRITYDFSPITFMATFWVSRKSADNALEHAQKILKHISKNAINVSFLGPVITLNPKKRGYVSAQIVVKSKQRTVLIHLAKMLPSGWQYDLEPINLL